MMKFKNTKLFLGTFILLAYMGVGLFGLFQLGHTAEMSPAMDCPYSLGSFSLCDNSISHIDHWHQFSNVTLTSVFIFSVLILGVILYFLSKQDFSIQEQYFYKWKYYLHNKKLYNHRYRIIKWLSLFENSPPVHRTSITISNLKNLCKQKNLKTIKTISSLILKWRSILFVVWNLIETKLRQAQITKARPTTFVLYTARITLQPIL